MNTMNEQVADRPEIESLLPWHAAGTLNRRDAQRVEQALAQDPDLARQYEMVRDDLTETIHLNESLGAPSARAMEKLFAAIEADEVAAPKRVPSFSLGAWLAETFSGFSGRKLAYSGIAAALVIALQAGVIGNMYFGGTGSGATWGTASQNPLTDPREGSYALIQFHPKATAEEIEAFLTANKLEVVYVRNGFYKVRLASMVLPQNQVNDMLTKYREDSKIIRFASATTAED